MKVLITSGGCKVPIDDVRHIGNFSSGRYGAELADEFTSNGHDVIFFHEEGSVTPKYVYHKYSEDQKVLINVNPTYIRYKNYDGYLSVKEVIKQREPDLIISAAAISDYIVDKTEGKISSNDDELIIKLRKGEKVIQSFRELAPLATIIGFKLLVSPTPEEKFEAIDKQSKYVDHVIYNDLTELRKGNDKRDLVYWTEKGKVCSHSLSVKELVHELIDIAHVNKVLKKVF